MITMDMRKKFGKWLFKELRLINWTMNKLMQKSGVEKQSILRYIQGDCFPSLRNIIAISKALNVVIGFRGDKIYVNGEKL